MRTCKVLGLALAPADAADYMNRLMMACAAFMALRFVSVMCPTWMKMPKLLYSLVVVVPKMNKEVKAQIHLRKDLEEEFIRQRDAKRAERDAMVKVKQEKRRAMNDPEQKKKLKEQKKKEKKEKKKKSQLNKKKKKKRGRRGTMMNARKAKSEAAAAASGSGGARRKRRGSVAQRIKSAGARAAPSRRQSLARHQSTQRLKDAIERKKAHRRDEVLARFRGGVRRLMHVRAFAPRAVAAGPLVVAPDDSNHDGPGGDEDFSQAALAKHRRFQQQQRQRPEGRDGLTPVRRFKGAAVAVMAAGRSVRAMVPASTAAERTRMQDSTRERRKSRSGSVVSVIKKKEEANGDAGATSRARPPEPPAGGGAQNDLREEAAAPAERRQRRKGAERVDHETEWAAVKRKGSGFIKL